MKQRKNVVIKEIQTYAIITNNINILNQKGDYYFLQNVLIRESTSELVIISKKKKKNTYKLSYTF